VWCVIGVRYVNNSAAGSVSTCTIHAMAAVVATRPGVVSGRSDDWVMFCLFSWHWRPWTGFHRGVVFFVQDLLLYVALHAHLIAFNSILYPWLRMPVCIGQWTRFSRLSCRHRYFARSFIDDRSACVLWTQPMTGRCDLDGWGVWCWSRRFRRHLRSHACVRLYASKYWNCSISFVYGYISSIFFVKVIGVQIENDQWQCM
jgi:hypothetical protein